MDKLHIRPAVPEDASTLLALYRLVSRDPLGLIRRPEEITPAYIQQFMQASLKRGLILLAELGEEVVAEMHAWTPDLLAFQHVLTGLTIVVHPLHQGKGIGKQLFTHFLQQVRLYWPHIHRVELHTRMHNQRNVRFYQRMGFQIDGPLKDQILSAEGKLETPLSMAWFNPGYKGNTQAP